MTIKETIITEVKTEGITKAGDEFRDYAKIVKKNGDKISQISKEFVSSLGNQMRQTTTINKKANTSYEKMQRVIRHNKLESKLMADAQKMNVLIAKSDIYARKRGAAAIDKVNKANERFTKSLKRFHAEYLSAMFGFQQIAQAMRGLLAPSFEMTGMFELLSTTLAVTFLPIALVLLDALIPIINLFLEMPESLKLALGALVVIVGGIAALGAAFFASKLFVQGFNDSIPALSKLLKDLSISTGDLSTKTLDLKNSLSLVAKTWTATLSIAVAKDAYDAFKGGDFLGGIIDTLKAATLIGFTVGKLSGRSLIQMYVGLLVAEDMITQFKAGEMMKSIGDAIIAGAIVTGKWKTGTGAALIAFGISLYFTDEIKDYWNWLQKIGEKGGDLVGGTIMNRPGYPLYIPPKKELTPFEKLAQERGVKLPGQATGGYIPQTGMRMLHAGEQVIPANQTFNSSPTININTTGGVDTFSLNQIQDIIARELASISRR